MSRRNTNLYNSPNILPLIKERKVRISNDINYIYQKFHSLEEINPDSLYELVEERKRFKTLVDKVKKLISINPSRQEDLRHLYIIEAYNKQDLIISAFYAINKFVDFGLVEASKIMIVPTHELIDNNYHITWKNDDEVVELVKSNRDGEDIDMCTWQDSYEAIASYIHSLTELPKIQDIYKIEQYPIFILIDKSEVDNFPKLYTMEDSESENSKKNKLFEYLTAGALYIEIPAIDISEALTFFRKYIKSKGYSISKSVNLPWFMEEVIEVRNTELSENDIKSLADTIIINHNIDGCSSNSLGVKDFNKLVDDIKVQEKINKENPYIKLDKMIGLDDVKDRIHQMITRIKFNKLRKEKGLASFDISFNAVFLGSPGTAKTSIARLVAEILQYEKFIDSADFQEVKKSDIVGRFVGWTASMVDNLFSSLSKKGGVIFFDEIYTLSEDESTAFDKEALTAIVQNMENHRNVFCIFAGYKDKMNQFLSRNPGLRSRIAFTFHFNDYSINELYEIFENIVIQNSYKLPDNSRNVVQKYFYTLKNLRKERFGNGREVRNLFELCTIKMASRLKSKRKLTKEELMKIELSDIEAASKEILETERLSLDSEEENRKIGFCI